MIPYPTRQFILDRLKTNKELVLSKSRMDCHVKGLHSLVLEEKEDGTLVRMYLTAPDHELYLNYGTTPAMTLAIHGHHCSMEFVGVYGQATNVRYTTALPPDTPSFSLVNGWWYSSALTEGKPGFRKLGTFTLRRTKDEFMSQNPVMRADELHTVCVDKGNIAAWLVVEKPDTTHKGEGFCFSNADLSKFDFAAHYKPVSEGDVNNLMAMIGLPSVYEV
jgi:hypothetical protein